jgi:Domain of unknown function (DUF4262)
LLAHPVSTMPAMCEICNGMTHEELFEREAALIAEHGYIVRGVDGDADHESWAYSIGLVDIADHPELIVVGVETMFAMRFVRLLSEWVLDGDRLSVGDKIQIADQGVARIGAVHDIQYTLETFASWHALHERGAVEGLLEAVQVVLPSRMFCAVHAHQQPLLDDPHARVGQRVRVNRAARRRRRRSA